MGRGADQAVRREVSLGGGAGPGGIIAPDHVLAEFPDRELLGEDVIWCDDPLVADEHRGRRADDEALAVAVGQARDLAVLPDLLGDADDEMRHVPPFRVEALHGCYPSAGPVEPRTISAPSI